MHEFTSRKRTRYMRIYTRWNYLLRNKLCHGKCRLNKFTPPPPVHDNLLGIYGMKRYLREFTSKFGKSTSKNTRQFVHPLCEVRFCYSACVNILKHSSLCKKKFLRFPIVKEENERHLLCEERQTIKKIKKNQHFNNFFFFFRIPFQNGGNGMEE